ncbi:hypothetical protein MUK42_08106 [Musa troglodytarum]|uniref:Uncharacterized protein n=1 Tax=Musa troglodytarum TaxID=320322 RepID=A0A9E7EHA4_9LILI|nr:hypothetical protein MUK42_08106 [Musa troglodytarum]
MEANRISPAQLNMHVFACDKLCLVFESVAHSKLPIGSGHSLPSCQNEYILLSVMVPSKPNSLTDVQLHFPLISFVVASRRSDCCYASKRSSLLFNEISERLQQVPSAVD